MERKRSQSKQPGGLYLKEQEKRRKSTVKMLSSGNTLLDLVNGGARNPGTYPLGRMTNLIGDKATGKSLVGGIEAFANFRQQYPKGLKFYREAESAFELGYAESIGMPVEEIDFGPDTDLKKGRLHHWQLVEDIYADLVKQCAKCRSKGVPGVYVVDSMDALSTKIDMERDFGEQTYRTDKPSQLGELFRKMTVEIEKAQIALIIISQTRARIGAMFGEKTTRSGGAALDFYATEINKLKHSKQISETIKGVKRVTAVRIKVSNVKNKLSESFRDCEFNIRFGYGINDPASCLEWLLSIKRWNDLDLSKEKAEKLLDYLNDLDKIAMEEWGEFLKSVTRKVWADVEEGFRPKLRKYVT